MGDAEALLLGPGDLKVALRLQRCLIGENVSLQTLFVILVVQIRICNSKIISRCCLQTFGTALRIKLSLSLYSTVLTEKENPLQYFLKIYTHTLVKLWVFDGVFYVNLTYCDCSHSNLVYPKCAT